MGTPTESKTYKRHLYYPREQEEPARSLEIKRIISEMSWLREQAGIEIRMWGRYFPHE